MHPALRRTLASLAAWTVGAVVAISVGVLALSAIGDGWASGRPPRAQQADSSQQVGAHPPTPAPPSRPTSSPRAGPVRTVAGRGGTVEAQCTGASVYLRSWSPDQGYQVDDVHRGPARVVSVKFSVPGRESTLRVRCVQGVPQVDTTWHGDDGGTHE
ncbi:MAG: hypothetical protein V7603_1804 [Micromonosporaceae bacterium]|jgi:hypothetical protein